MVVLLPAHQGLNIPACAFGHRRESTQSQRILHTSVSWPIRHEIIQNLRRTRPNRSDHEVSGLEVGTGGQDVRMRGRRDKLTGHCVATEAAACLPIPVQATAAGFRKYERG